MARMIRATDFYLLKQCNRQVYLNYHGDSAQFRVASGYYAWVVRQGTEFEHEVAASLGVMQPGTPADGLDERFRLTVEYMQQGVAAIYQGVLKHDGIVGSPDLLLKMPGSSQFGPYFYRPVDVKSTQTSEEEHRLQVMAYIALLNGIQGMRPDGALLLRVPPAERVNGQIYREEVIVYDDALYQQNLAEVIHLMAGFEPPVFLSSICGKCGWQKVCTPIAEAAQDVSQIPGMKRRVWEQLHERGLGTLNALAEAQPEVLITLKGVGEKTASEIIRQARSLADSKAIRLAAPNLRRSDCAVFFDIESLPTESLYYLMGTSTLRDGQISFAYDIAKQRGDERLMWDAFLTRMDASDCPVYHYGSYEKISLKKLMDRYGEDARAQRLIERLVDLERVLKDSMVLPLRGYSLKDVAPWLGFQWTGKTQGAEDSMMEYLHWFEDSNHAHLDNIIQYNRDDCQATYTVYRWLMSLMEANQA